MSKLHALASYPVFCLSLGMTVSATAANLTVATYGGDWGDAMQSCVIEPFTRASGNTVTPEPGVSGVTLSKMTQQSANPTIDVAWLDGGISELAAKAGLLAELSPERIPGLNTIIPQGIYRLPTDAVYAVSTGFYAMGLVYNTEAVAVAPTSWSDLWNPDYAGLVTLPSPSNAMGIPFLMAINRLAGGPPEDLSKGMAKIQSLQAFAFFDTSGNATNSYQSGEVEIGAHYASATWALADKKLPVAYVVPKEGALGGDIRLHITRNSKNLKAAEAFVQFAIEPTQAACMSNRLYLGPATKGVTLSDIAKERMPWGKSGSIDSLTLTDWELINDRRGAINDQWNKSLSH